MKKILASILVLTMLVCCMSISAFAEGAPASITIDSVTVEAGKEAQFPVNVKVTGDFAAVKLELSIDSALTGAEITYIEQGAWTLNNSSAFESNTANGQTVWGNKVNVDIARKGEGSICTYYVSVPADAINGDYTITLNCIDYCYVDANNNDKVTTITGLTTTDTATLTVVGGKDAPVEPPVHEHEAGSAWEKDENGHWNVCSCGEKLNEGAHEYDNDQDADCNVCGATREVEAPHEHEAGSKWENDENGHWNVCSCGEKLNEGAHEYDNDQDADCNVCGATREVDDGNDDGNDDGDDGKDDGDDGKDDGDDGKDDGDDGKDDEKEEDKKDDTTDTGDNTNLYIYMALCLFAAAAIVVTSYELKKTRG